MARKRQFGSLRESNRQKIYREGARYGLTQRQTRERYNRGTFNPLSRTPEKQVPKNAPYYPTETGRALKDRAMRNIDRALGDLFLDPFSEANRVTILDAVEHHASDEALRRMANASPDELKKWARYQKKYTHTVKSTREKIATPEWARSLGWRDENGKWHNIFWYH